MSHNNHWDDKGHPGTGTTYAYGGVTTYSAKTCKHHPKPVKAGDVEIYGCSQYNVDLAIKEGFDVISPLVPSCGSEFNGYYGLLLWFPIADMTAPDAQRLRIHASRLIQLARAGNRVVTYCIGSHGRTGTVIATCIGLLEPDVDPIDAVRARHCADSVETQKQIEAVFAACGRELPEKWKEKKHQPAWVQQGKTWDPNSKDVTNDLVPAGDKWNCYVCKEPGGLGVDQLHWFGAIRAHMDCYERIQVKAREIQAKEQAKNLAVTSSKTPSADSPPAISNTQQTALPIGGYPIKETKADDTDVPDADAEVTAVDRPFFDKWTEKQKRKYKFVANEKDQFGDLKCHACGYLVTNPYAAQKVGDLAFHRNCSDAQKLFDSVPLCVSCDEAYVDPPNEFCAECAEAINNVTDQIIDIEKDEDKI